MRSRQDMPDAPAIQKRAKWRKLGLVWAPAGDEWWAKTHAFVPTPEVIAASHIRVYCTVLDAQKVGRVTYVDLALDDPTRVVRVAQQPVFDVGELGCFDTEGVNASSVIDSDGRKWLYYIGWQHTSRVPYMQFSGAACSVDGGETFVRVQRVPVLDRTEAEPFSRSAAFVIASGDELKMWYSSCERWSYTDGMLHYNNLIRYAASSDGIHWRSKPHVCIAPRGPDEYAVGRPWVIAEGGGYRMWFSARSFSRLYTIGYAESDDGIGWKRIDDDVIPRSESGWDAEMTCYPAVIDCQGRRFMFYNGNRHGESGFGVAVLEQ